MTTATGRKAALIFANGKDLPLHWGLVTGIFNTVILIGKCIFILNTFFHASKFFWRLFHVINLRSPLHVCMMIAPCGKSVMLTTSIPPRDFCFVMDGNLKRELFAPMNLYCCKSEAIPSYKTSSYVWEKSEIIPSCCWSL